MRVLKWSGGILLILVILVAGLFLLARYADGPIEFIPGGPLVSGEVFEGPVTDWTFAASLETIEMQLLPDDNRSRTTWILVHEGAAFIPCTLGYPPGKDWHNKAVRDGRAIVRIQGTRYPVYLSKVQGTAMQGTLAKISSAKYPPAPGSDAGSWYFELEHRPSG
jgi:hypothetical protein